MIAILSIIIIILIYMYSYSYTLIQMRAKIYHFKRSMLYIL